MTYMRKQDRLLLPWVLFPWEKTKLFMAHRPEEPVFSGQSIAVNSTSSRKQKQVFNRKIRCIFLWLVSKIHEIDVFMGNEVLILGNITDLSTEATKVNTKFKFLVGALIEYNIK